ncbi:MAG: hypothetical protein A2Y21_11425 [Clostridiales bacterium GWC2_40_7]|nr:MAG: hypothetical protein A2Y21_11425 [Clostridiales bacterium GWC2_40_7]
MKKPTSRDVANLAGVSPSTVSFVLNDRKDISISDGTRLKVLDAAKQLNYTPNQFARGLKTNQSKLIGLIIPTITNPYYPMLTQSIEEYAASSGYNILLCNTYRKVENEEFYLNLLTNKSVDGIIYGFTPNYPQIACKISSSIPVVIIGEKDDTVKISTVALNSFMAGEMIGQHLISLGHKNIAFITSPLEGMSLSRQKRLHGIKSKLKEYNLEKNLVIKAESYENESNDSTYEIEIGYNLTSTLIKETKVTAVIGVNDMVAFGALNAINNMQLKVPEDISVCGFDNIYLSKVIRPGITTVDHLTFHRSKLAIDILINRMGNGDEDVYRVEYEPRLIVRESTGPV